jgi:Tfp pilus assembly protein PilX
MVTRRRADDGSVLVLTLVFTVVLAVVVLALAEYATVGLRTSRAATMRTETTADASSAVSWAIERFAKKELTPAVDCDKAPYYREITLPAGLLSAGVTVDLTCAETTPMTGEPVIHLIAVTTSGPSTRTVEATVEVPSYLHGARVADWRVDLPIAVPPLVTTTTVTPTTTTTTTTSTTTTTTVPETTTTTTTDPLAPPESTTTTTTSSTTTTTTLAPRPTCRFRVTGAEANGKAGSGVLSISNVGGGSFSGWTVRIAQSSTADPWQFTWDSSVTATVTSAHVTVGNGSSNADVTADAVDLFNVTAGLVVDKAQAIVAGAQLTCTFISPAP